MVLITVNASEEDSTVAVAVNSAKELDYSRGTVGTVEATDDELSPPASPMPRRSAPIVITEDDVNHHLELEEPVKEVDEQVVDNEDPLPHFRQPPNTRVARETYFHSSLIKDSIQVQKHHKVNDDEVHEENPHLQDFLIPHHSFHVGRDLLAGLEEADVAADEGDDKDTTDNKVLPLKKDCSTRSILSSSVAGVSPEELIQEEDTEKPKRQVSFGSVLVRDYDMILGDHPCCTYGPPVTLDWDYLEYESLAVDDYEFHHPPRRGLREMGMNYYQRKAVLARAGYNEGDFKSSMKRLSKDKFNRSISRSVASNYPLLKAEAAVESARRKFKRLLKDDHWKSEKKSFSKRSLSV